MEKIVSQDYIMFFEENAGLFLVDYYNFYCYMKTLQLAFKLL